jgi:phenylalanyl-tRNA synthetase beta subunit
LFDIFDLSEGKTSFTFHIIFGAKDRTLTNDEVDEMMKKIIFDLEKELKIEVRK